MSDFVPTTTALPASMVEAAARALHEHDRLEFTGDLPWDRLFSAALGECDVREEWGCHYLDLHAEDGRVAHVTWWHPQDDRRAIQDFADEQPWGSHACVVHRLSITTLTEPAVDALTDLGDGS